MARRSQWPSGSIQNRIRMSIIADWTDQPSQKIGRILAWPFKKQEAKDLLDSIERQKSLFVLALQNDNLCVDIQITREVLPHF